MKVALTASPWTKGATQNDDRISSPGNIRNITGVQEGVAASKFNVEAPSFQPSNFPTLNEEKGKIEAEKPKASKIAFGAWAKKPNV